VLRISNTYRFNTIQFTNYWNNSFRIGEPNFLVVPDIIVREFTHLLIDDNLRYRDEEGWSMKYIVIWLATFTIIITIEVIGNHQTLGEYLGYVTSMPL